MGLSYRGWDNVRPRISCEHFLALSGFEPPVTDKWRVTIGAGFTVGAVELEPFLRIDMRPDEPDQPSTYIVGFKYTANRVTTK